MCNFFLFLFYLKEMLVLSFQVNIEINISRLPIKLDIPLKKKRKKKRVICDSFQNSDFFFFFFFFAKTKGLTLNMNRITYIYPAGF
jgi:hypothetical protein